MLLWKKSAKSRFLLHFYFSNKMCSNQPSLFADINWVLSESRIFFLTAEKAEKTRSSRSFFSVFSAPTPRPLRLKAGGKPKRILLKVSDNELSDFPKNLHMMKEVVKFMSEAAVKKINHPYITRKDGVCGGRAIIAGTRIKVAQIAIEYDQMGKTSDEIIQSHSVSRRRR